MLTHKLFLENYRFHTKCMLVKYLFFSLEGTDMFRNPGVLVIRNRVTEVRFFKLTLKHYIKPNLTYNRYLYVT